MVFGMLEGAEDFEGVCVRGMRISGVGSMSVGEFDPLKVEEGWGKP